MAVLYNGLWKLLIDKNMKKNGSNESSRDQQQYGGENDKRRAGILKSSGKNLCRIRLRFW